MTTAPIAAALLAVLAAAPVASATTFGSFVLKWTDRLGVTHPLLSTNVTLYDSNNGVETPIGTWVTDGVLGRLNFSTNYTRPDGSQLQIVGDVKAMVTGVGTAATEGFAEPYSFRLAGPYAMTPNINNPPKVPPAITNTSDAGKAIGFLQGMKVASDHFMSLGLATPYVNVRFTPSWPGGSFMSGASMTLRYNGWGAWDEAFHEFAHGVASASGLDIDPQIGSSHSFNRDNISHPDGPELGPEDGTQFAWQEAIATYMGTSALHNRLPTAIPGAPATDSNTVYDRLGSFGSVTPDTPVVAPWFAVDLERRTGQTLQTSLDANNKVVYDRDINGNYIVVNVNAIGQGEGEELSIARVLWDLEDNTPSESLPRAGRTDQVALGAQGVVDLMKAAGGRLAGLWQAARESFGTTPLARSLLGDVFEANSVSAIPGALAGVADGASTFSQTPTLAWTEQNSGHSSKFLVAVYSADFSTLLELSPELSDTTTWALSDPLPPGMYNWVVISNSVLQSAVDFDDSYWSGSASFTIIPEPVAISLIAAFPVVRRRPRR